MTSPRRIGWRLVVGAVLVASWLTALYAAKVGVPFEFRLDPSGVWQDQGFAYITKVPPPRFSGLFRRSADALDQPPASTARLFENDRLLGAGHTLHSFIRASGHGAFSDWMGQLYFSTSDNTDPRSNGRTYSLRDRSYLYVGVYHWVTWIVALSLAALCVNLLSGRIAHAAPSLAILTHPSGKRPLRFAGLLTLGALICAVVLLFLSGVPFWIAAFSCVVLGLLAMRQLLLLAGLMRGVSWTLSWLQNFALTITSIGICVVGFEGYLAWLESTAVRGQQPVETRSIPSETPEWRKAAWPVRGEIDVDAPPLDSAAPSASIQLPAELIDEMSRRKQLLSLPPDWERKRVDVAHAARAYLWHGVLHIHDDNGFRRLDVPYPKKRADVMRVMVVGDSMTYGDGIREEWTYTAQLERAMRKNYRIEFFNLGVDGHQSEDVANVITRMLPEIDPDLLIYGVCHNDFLPSGVGQYKREYPFPLPERLKQLLLTHTRFARFLSDNYQSMLLLLGLSMDFYDDILENFANYQERFGSDVKRMNSLVRSHGLPPIVGMTLDQFVELGGRGHRVSRIAERLMREAGFDVISTEEYYKRFDGHTFLVSRWEGHPDEEANAIFAKMLYVALTGRSDVKRFAIGSGNSP